MSVASAVPPPRHLVGLLLMALLGCEPRTSFEVPDGYLESCSGEGDSGCAEGLDCFSNPGSGASEYVCSSSCTEAADCPPGTKACGDGDATQCRSGVCYYSEFCY